LIGLPPSPADFESFITEYQSDSESAYSNLVEQLLASPRFGEHFGRHWLDFARYADSITLRGFVLPEAWRYRDYVIESFNRDRPFNEMMIEQVAGDLLPSHGSTPEGLHRDQMQNVATGFLVLGNTNLERQDKTQLDMDFIDEQLEVLGRAFLGQTIGCARCHDHKFDPIPTSDYYALAGIFRSAKTMEHDNVSKWIEKPLPLTAEEEERYQALSERIVALDKRIAELDQVLANEPKPDYLNAAELNGIVLDDQQAKLDGPWNPSKHVKPFVESGYHFLDPSAEGQATYAPDDLDPGRYDVRVAYTPGSNRSSSARVRVFSAAGSQDFRVNQQKPPTIDGVWHSLGEFTFEGRGQAYVMLLGGDASGVVIADAVQFLPVSTPKTPLVTSTEEAIASTSESKRTDSPNAIQLAKAEKENTTQIRKRLASQLKRRPMYLTLDETPNAQDIPIHIRGDVHNLGETVPRGFLTAVTPGRNDDDGELSRRELAKWLASPKNPLPARVYANRVWLWLMGNGLVSTPNNFGTTGATPTHPQLLDALAHQLIANDWSTKQLVRTIVHSEAYQRSSRTPTDAAKKHLLVDPNNALYWRGQRRRLSVEALRDTLLTASEEIEHSLGGSLIKPGTKADYNYEHQSVRRSVYQPVFRNSLPELFEAFDFADPSTSFGNRPRSTVATQALVLMNHPWVEERVSAIAERLIATFPSDNALQSESGRQQASANGMIEQTYLLLLQRQPTDTERAVSLEFLLSNSMPAFPSKDAVRIWIHSLVASLDFRYLD
ncbi:MAG: DUF1553 domain-containing protein, partial [Planctomycetota bacterium]